MVYILYFEVCVFFLLLAFFTFLKCRSWIYSCCKRLWFLRGRSPAYFMEDYLSWGILTGSDTRGWESRGSFFALSFLGFINWHVVRFFVLLVFCILSGIMLFVSNCWGSFFWTLVFFGTVAGSINKAQLWKLSSQDIAEWFCTGFFMSLFICVLHGRLSLVGDSYGKWHYPFLILILPQNGNLPQVKKHCNRETFHMKKHRAIRAYSI